MNLEIKLGDRLRSLRKSHGMSLRELADRAQCSSSFLSQLELGQNSPSVSSLERICRALGMELQDFFNESRPAIDAVIVRHEAPRQILEEWEGAQLQFLLPREANSSFTALRLQLPAHGRSALRRSRRTMHELGIVVVGQVEIEIDGRRESLSSGDSVYFDLTSAHRWINPHDAVAEVLLVNSNFTDVYDIPPESDSEASQEHSLELQTR